MTKRSALVAAAFATLLLAPMLPAQTADVEAASPGVSKVRIVRLSEAKGVVRMDRNTGRGFEDAMANLPIVENSQLETGQGVAEVEFEDNSTLRLAPESVVEFPQLERLGTGATVSSVHVLKGMAYISLVKTKTPNEFNLLFGEKKLALQPGSHIRLHMDGVEARLAVFDGSVKVDGESAALDVPKKKTVTFDLLEHKQPAIAKDILPEPTDSWDQTNTGYHARAASFGAFGNSPYSYGVNDMMYYGSFMNAAGCGSMWRPYFASAAWDPYANGAYAYYPGAGYSWVSPYPWGWTPYHSGSWSYCPSAGWGWQPGGSWNGLNNFGPSMIAYRGRNPIPPAPVHPPRPGDPTLRAVNSKPLVRSELAKEGAFVFRKDSAGIGIPRDGLGKLNKFSEHAVQRGTVSTPVYVSVPNSAMPNGNGRATNTGVAPVAVHRGSPPAYSGGGQPNAGPAGGFGGARSGGGGGGGGFSGGGGASAPRSSGGPSPSSQPASPSRSH
jgi:hypothetical protein